MKSHMIVLVLVIAGLVIAGGVALAKSSEPPSATAFTFAQTTMYGGNYQLNGGCEGFSIVSDGGGLRLTTSGAPELAGSGCCCTYLPTLNR